MAKASKAKPKGETPNLPAVAMKLPGGFTVARVVTTPQWKWPVDDLEPRYMKIVSQIVQSTRKIPVKEGQKTKEPPFVGQVIDLIANDGVVRELIFPAVLRSELDRNYPEHGYINKSFAIQSQPKEGGKNYRNFRILEINAPSGE